MSFGFSTALSGLQAARAAIQTIGQNIANQATPGYSRQRVDLQTGKPLNLNGLLFGTGVIAGNVTRTVDQLLLGRIRTQESLLGYYDVQYSRLNELESFLNEPSEQGLAARISSFFSSIQQLSEAPEDAARRESMLSNSRLVVTSFGQLANQIAQHENDLNEEVSSQVEAANSLIDQIAVLNGQVLAIEGGTAVEANDVRDQREEMVKRLSKLINVTATEDQNGALRVQASGSLLVANIQSFHLERVVDSENNPQVRVEDTTVNISNPGGRIGGLISLANGRSEQFSNSLDNVAYNLIREINRIHSTGIGRTGSFTNLTALYTPTDSNLNGVFTDELLSNNNFAFPIQEGDVYVTVTNTSTGLVEKNKLTISPSILSMSGVANLFSSVNGLNASVDAAGRLRISAQNGYTFDFSPRLVEDPNVNRTFGSSSGTVSSTLQEPFSLANNDAMTISVDGGGAQAVTFLTGDFADISNATAEEVAAKINSSTAGLTARVIDGRVVISSDTVANGTTTSSIQIADGAGSPAAAMGLSTSVNSGNATGTVAVRIGGSYTGSTNERWTFRADSPGGELGVTEGLTMGVFNEDGNRVATLNVGQGYSLGTSLSIIDGVTVSFGAGSISSSSGDFFNVDVVNDADTSDLLVGLGLNVFFEGSTALDMRLTEAVDGDVDNIAASMLGTPEDNKNLLRMLEIQDSLISSLGGKTIEEYYGGELGKVGFDVSSSYSLLQTQSFVSENLEIQRLQVSGVSVDEEMAQLLQFQQMFEAMSRYVSILSELEQGLIATL